MPFQIQNPCRLLLRFVCFTAIFLSLPAFPLSTAEDPSLKKMTLMTAWLPQAQFAGFYAALEKGIYKKYGLEVSILHGSPDRSPYDFLINKKADVAIFWLAAGIEKKAQGSPLIHIAQIIQKSALMLIAKKTSGIVSPQDMRDRKVGLWGEIYQIQPRALFEKFNIQPVIIPQGYSVNLFLRGGTDVTSAMWYNEYHTILNAGYNPEDLTTFFFSDYDLNFPEDGLYVLSEKLAQDPTRYEAFVKASIEGWLFAFAHPDETLDLVLSYMKEAHLPANRVHQKWMLERMRDVMAPRGGTKEMGELTREEYLHAAGVLQKEGWIREIPDFKSFHKPTGFSRDQ